MSDPNHELIFLPNIRIEKPFSFGGFEFWNWKKGKYLKVKDKDILKFLTSFLRKQVGLLGDTAREVSVASKEGEPPLAPLGARDKARLREVLDCLAFGLLASDSSAAKYCYDNFRAVPQPFDPPARTIAIHRGRLVRERYDSLDIDQVQLTKPDLAAFSGPLLREPDFADALLACTASDDPEKAALFQACQLFNACHANDEQLTDRTRIMLLANAFEVLYRNHQVIEQFTKRIGGSYRMASDPVKSYRLSFWDANSRQRVNVERKLTLSEWWAHRFHVLLNEIMLGTPVREEKYLFENRHHHFTIAREVFADVVYAQLKYREIKTTGSQPLFDKLRFAARKYFMTDGSEQFSGQSRLTQVPIESRDEQPLPGNGAELRGETG